MSASHRPDTFELTMDDLPVLHEALLPVATEWYNVGLHIGIPVHELNVIEADHCHEGAKTCLRKVLMIWLKSLGRQAPSWPNLVAVLRKEGVGGCRLAAKLEQQHCPQPQVPQGSVSDSSSAAKLLLTGQPKSSKKDIKSEDIVPAFKKGDSRTDTLLNLLNRVDRPVREITDSDGKTLLHLACRHSHIQWHKVVMSLVHDHHCDLSTTDRDGNLPLHDACGYNNEELVKYLLTLPGWSPNVKNSESETALHVAIYKGSRNIVRIMLASGRVNHTLHSCKTPDINPEIKTLLNNFKECVDKYNSPTPYPLLTCCVLISLLNEFLLKSSDNRCTLNEIVTASRQHEAPLPFDDITQMKNLLSLIKQHFQIIENDRDLDTIVCKHPRPPPVYAVQDVQPSQLEEEILEIGLETSSHSEQEPVIAETMANSTPEKESTTLQELLRGFKEGDERMTELLKRVDRPIKAITDEDGKTLLHLACSNKTAQWLAIAKTLVEVYSCDPSAQDRYGNTPLHDACQHKNQELLEYLLSLESCDANIRNLRNETALHIAKESLVMSRTLLASGRMDSVAVREVLALASPHVKTILDNHLKKSIVGPSNAPQQAAADNNHPRLLSQATSGDPIEHVSEREAIQLLESEDATHQRTGHQQPRTIRRNRLRDFRDCCSSCGKSTAVCCASCLQVGRMCCSRCRENGRDCRSSEDSSRIKCVSYKDCWRKHPIRCAIGLLITVMISLLLGFSFILVSSLTPTDPMSGAILTRPNDTVLVRNEGFDPSQFATVVIAKALPTDLHVVNFYREHCNELTALQLAIEKTGSRLEIAEQNTLISSYYLLVDSELTFVVTLNETVDQNHSEIIIYNSVVDHFNFIQLNITSSRPLHRFNFSNGPTNFTLTASNSSYYFIDLFTPLSAGPTSIQYQVNGTISYYNTTDLQRECAIIPGVNTSCFIPLQPRTSNQYCILTQANSFKTDNKNTFVSNIYASVPLQFTDSQLSWLIIGTLLSTLAVLLLFFLGCFFLHIECVVLSN